MALSVADIAKKAFDGVSAGLSGVVKTATLTKEVRGAFNATSGSHALTSTDYTGRAVIGTAGAIPRKFPDYTVTPNDTLISLEGFTVVPAIGDLITIDSKERAIKAIGDIVGAGSFFEVVAV